MLVQFSGQVPELEVGKSEHAGDRKIPRKRRGATALEYAVMLNFIFLALILAVQHLGSALANSFSISSQKTGAAMGATANTGNDSSSSSTAGGSSSSSSTTGAGSISSSSSTGGGSSTSSSSGGGSNSSSNSNKGSSGTSSKKGNQE